MYLHRIHLDLRSREARRDLADAYQCHATLSRAFSLPDTRCAEGAFLWRLEPEVDPDGYPRILVLGRQPAEWSRINLKQWLARDPDPPINLRDRLHLDTVQAGQKFRFRLRANPSVTSKGKRVGLTRVEEQEAWLRRQGQEHHGFELPGLPSFDLEAPTQTRVDIRISGETKLRCQQAKGNTIQVFSVLFDGLLTVTDPARFRAALAQGIGHGKALGLGLLSVVPVR